MKHVEDDAELYALGLLDDGERATVAMHLVDCAACTRAVGAAEATAARLASTLPRRTPTAALGKRIALASGARADRPSRRAWMGGALAVAAAAVLAIIPLANDDRTLRGDLADDTAALSHVLHSHFDHTAFAPSPGGAPIVAKVLFARDASWYYVVVDDARASVRISGVVGTAVRDFGEPHRKRGIATLFIAAPGRLSEVRIVEGGRVDARAILTRVPTP